MEQACYLEQVIPEYQGNPMIEALPEIWAGDTVEEMLSEEAPHHDGERMLDSRYRMALHPTPFPLFPASGAAYRYRAAYFALYPSGIPEPEPLHKTICKDSR